MLATTHLAERLDRARTEVRSHAYRQRKAELDQELDQALQDTFPASDAVAMIMPGRSQ